MAASTASKSILVVGAGPVGLTAALELQRRGFSPRVIDKAAGPASESRALAVNPRTLDILGPSGVTEELLAIGNPVSRLDVTQDARRLLSVRIGRLRHRYPFMLIVPQADTERILMHALAQRGIEVEWGTEVMDVAWQGDRPQAMLATADDTELLEPDLLIGADGAHSTVRQVARIPFAGESYPMVFALADVRYPLPRDAHVATVELFRGGAVASFPFDAYTFRHAGTSGDIVELVKDRRTASEVLWRSTFHVSFRQVSSFRRGNVFLAGDSAHIHSPVGGRGMNLGIEDAAWLAYLIAEGREADYSDLRGRAARRVLKQTHRMTDFIFQRNMVRPLVARLAGTWLLAIPMIEQLALRRLAGLDTPTPPWLDIAKR